MGNVFSQSLMGLRIDLVLIDGQAFQKTISSRMISFGADKDVDCRTSLEELFVGRQIFLGEAF